MCPRMRTRLPFPREDAVELGGSCQCGAVRFSVDSLTPYPYQACYCSICRKTAGGGGYAINLGGDSSSLEVEGERTSASTGRGDKTQRTPRRRSAQRGGTSAVTAAVRCGYMSRVGPNWSTPSPRPSIRPCRSHQRR